jgi:hypothetical protein
MELASLAIRLVALLWTILITALIGNVIASNINGHMGAINLAMFVAALSWIAILYGLAASIITSILVPIALLVIDILALLFTFISAIVLSAELGARNCGNANRHRYSRGWIAYGSHNNEKRCREIQASTAFMWFLWATFCAAVFFSWKMTRGFGSSRSRSGPSMSQVRA